MGQQILLSSNLGAADGNLENQAEIIEFVEYKKNK
jgi:hypothetical protein